MTSHTYTHTCTHAHIHTCTCDHTTHTVVNAATQLMQWWMGGVEKGRRWTLPFPPARPYNSLGYHYWIGSVSSSGVHRVQEGKGKKSCDLLLELELSLNSPADLSQIEFCPHPNCLHAHCGLKLLSLQATTNVYIQYRLRLHVFWSDLLTLWFTSHNKCLHIHCGLDYSAVYRSQFRLL